MTISRISNTNSYPVNQDAGQPTNTNGGRALEATPARHSSPRMPSHHYHPGMIHDRHHHLHHGKHHHHSHDPKHDKKLIAIADEAINKLN